MGPGYFWWGGMWIFPTLMMVIFLVVLYVIFVRGGFRPPWLERNGHLKKRETSETALDILKKRYAKGDISLAEFEQMKRTIEA